MTAEPFSFQQVAQLRTATEQKHPEVVRSNAKNFTDFVGTQAFDLSKSESRGHLRRQVGKTAFESLPKFFGFQQSDCIKRPTDRRLILAPMTPPDTGLLKPIHIF